jgi:hypothetical protein
VQFFTVGKPNWQSKIFIGIVLGKPLWHQLCSIYKVSYSLSSRDRVIQFAIHFNKNVACFVQGIPPGHEYLNIGRMKIHSSMTFL